MALILPLLLWAGNPETKTVTACVEHYAALELLYQNRPVLTSKSNRIVNPLFKQPMTKE